MTDVHEATVEVLTAEVRVLQVGSRQITLSVARQLDLIEPELIIPFGRITTGRRANDAEVISEVEVIGRADDGSLARSVATVERMVCGQGYHPGSHYVLNGGAAEAGRCDEHRTAPPAETHYWGWSHPDRETVRAWEALPLIVLAGLR
jgi:hypothetical protein